MVCKPTFDANLPHENLAMAPTRLTQALPWHASSTTMPTCRTKTLPPQHSTQVPPHQPIAHEPHHNATHHGATQKPHQQPTATPSCTPLSPLLTSYSSTS